MLMRDVEAVVATPARNFSAMRAQPLVPWTPARLLVALWNWLIAEDQVRPESETVPATGTRGNP